MLSDNPREIRQVIQGIRQRQDQLLTQVNDLTTAEMQAQQRAQINAIKEIVTHSYSRSAAYTNLILVAGYAAFFTVWKAMKSDLNEILILLSGLLVLVSVLLFVFFEVYGMFVRTLHFGDLQRKLAQKPSPTFVQEIQAAEKELMAKAFRVWRIIFVPTVLLGMVGGLLLAVAFGYGLVVELIK